GQFLEDVLVGLGKMVHPVAGDTLAIEAAGLLAAVVSPRRELERRALEHVRDSRRLGRQIEKSKNPFDSGFSVPEQRLIATRIDPMLRRVTPMRLHFLAPVENAVSERCAPAFFVGEKELLRHNDVTPIAVNGQQLRRWKDRTNERDVEDVVVFLDQPAFRAE